MPPSLHQVLTAHPVSASAPCRIDMGGTLDISTFHLPLRRHAPCTVNLAMALRTRVVLQPHAVGQVKVSSRGFESAAFPTHRAPFRHPLGLMFAIAAFFDADGVHIRIDSASPPRSALGGSSAAAVALVAALQAAAERAGSKRRLSRREVALLAHAIEASVAGVPCGLQDQLAAAFGGVNVWHWLSGFGEPAFRREALHVAPGGGPLADHLLVAYCGVPHESQDVNGRWVRQFLAGEKRASWEEIAALTRRFAADLRGGDFEAAADAMNRETAVRRELTPAVLDATGEKLVAAAIDARCGARFTGAGGGGCLWALGPRAAIKRLTPAWQKILDGVADARLLAPRIDTRGVAVEAMERDAGGGEPTTGG
jgi:D-glycero-alpha-D-manno-heptose-7-phosphate kinase